MTKKLEIVCYGYHQFDFDGDGPPIAYPTLTIYHPCEAFRCGWDIVEDLMFHPQAKPEWVCPECKVRYEAYSREKEFDNE